MLILLKVVSLPQRSVIKMREGAQPIKEEASIGRISKSRFENALGGRALMEKGKNIIANF